MDSINQLRKQRGQILQQVSAMRFSVKAKRLPEGERTRLITKWESRAAEIQARIEEIQLEHRGAYRGAPKATATTKLPSRLTQAPKPVSHGVLDDNPLVSVPDAPKRGVEKLAGIR